MKHSWKHLTSAIVNYLYAALVQAKIVLQLYDILMVAPGH